MAATVMVALLVSAGAGGGQARTSVEDTNSSARVRDLAIGYDHACILLTDGTVRCWGHGDEGQLGAGDTSGSVALVEVRDLTSVAALAAGGDHTCALLEEGSVRCWGANGSGQLGDGTTTDSPLPVPVIGLDGAVAVAAGYYHTCVIVVDGTVRCWGRNEDGQLGADTGREDSAIPLAVAGLRGAVRVSTGPYMSCAVLADGTATCWGDVPGEPADEAICTTDEDGTVRCTSGLPEGEAPRWLPEPVPGLDEVTDLAIGDAHVCALLEDGTVGCWGRNSEGQLGDGTTDESVVPVRTADPAGIRAVAAGWYHTCALLTDGTVRCWGGNSEGQLGDGSTDDSCPPWSCPADPDEEARQAWCDRCASPITVIGLDGVVDLETGSGRTCALRADDTIACWGHKAAQYPTNCPQNDCRSPVEIDLGPGVA